MLRTIAMLILLACQVRALSPEETVQKIEATKWMTEQYPPYNYTDKGDGQLRGITVDVLMLVFERVGAHLTRADIMVLPWTMGYKEVLRTPNTALFSTTYTVERAKHLKFVGPIIPTRVAVLADTSRRLIIDGVDDLNLLTIAVVKDDIGDQLIRTLGVTPEAIRTTLVANNMIKKLLQKEVQAIAYAEDIAWYRLVKAGIDPKKYESVYTLQESFMGYAFHNSTEPEVLELLNKALGELRAEGVVDSIRHQYLGE